MSETSNGKKVLDQKRRSNGMGRDALATAATPATAGRIPQQEVKTAGIQNHIFLVPCSKDYLSCSPPRTSLVI
jgi:hypothetical protein